MLRRLAYGVAVLGIMSLVALVIVTLIYQQYLQTPIDPNRKERVVVEIPKGSLRDVLDVLVQQGLVTQPTLFEIHADLTGKATQVKAGAFFLDYQWTPSELLHHLVEGTDPATRRLRLAAGLNQWRIAERVAKAGIGTEEKFLKVIRNWDLAGLLGLPVRQPSPTRFEGLDLSFQAPLEGYLFPDTYEFPWETTEADVVERATRAFRKTWSDLKAEHQESYLELQKKYKLSDHDFVILASLVQKEAVMDDERPLIAGVFYNRIRDGWKLQTDPTLIYHPDHFRERPAPRHRKNKKLPYNTYARKGLPPGPIASPGKASLEAVLAPKASNYFFFVARADGSNRHAFSTTLKQHRNNIRSSRK